MKDSQVEYFNTDDWNDIGPAEVQFPGWYFRITQNNFWSGPYKTKQDARVCMQQKQLDILNIQQN